MVSKSFAASQRAVFMRFNKDGSDFKQGICFAVETSRLDVDYDREENREIELEIANGFVTGLSLLLVVSNADKVLVDDEVH